MNFVTPARRLALRASTITTPTTLVLQQTRSKWSFSALSSLNPFATKKTPQSVGSAEGLDNPATRKQLFEQTFSPKVENSIFEDEIKEAKEDDSAGEMSAGNLDPAALIAARDPDQRGRLRWERRKVAQLVLRRGSETVKDVIERTERTMTFKSPLMPTSTKKLMYLAQQIAGKPLDEAMLQMSYSKKKMAKEIRLQLEKAKDRAVAVHGMGLGKFNGEAKGVAPRKIQDKEGKWRVISDPTTMYVDQAWVNKGEKRFKRAIHLGRGRRVAIRSHQSTISVVVKEEKTRIRRADEKKVKEQRRKPWVHLPHRPVSQQHQYYLW